MGKISATINELERLLAKQKQRLEKLRKRKARLISQVARIDQQIDQLAGKPVAAAKAPRRRRRKRGKSLQQYVVDVLRQSPEPKTAGEITDAVIAAGYRTSSKNPISLVRQVCYHSGQVKAKERGKFVLATASLAPRPRRRKRKAAPE